jgi:hypothetical protein
MNQNHERQMEQMRQQTLSLQQQQQQGLAAQEQQAIRAQEQGYVMLEMFSPGSNIRSVGQVLSQLNNIQGRNLSSSFALAAAASPGASSINSNLHELFTSPGAADAVASSRQDFATFSRRIQGNVTSTSAALKRTQEEAVNEYASQALEEDAPMERKIIKAKAPNNQGTTPSLQQVHLTCPRDIIKPTDGTNDDYGQPNKKQRPVAETADFLFGGAPGRGFASVIGNASGGVALFPQAEHGNNRTFIPSNVGPFSIGQAYGTPNSGRGRYYNRGRGSINLRRTRTPQQQATPLAQQQPSSIGSPLATPQQQDPGQQTSGKKSESDCSL